MCRARRRRNCAKSMADTASFLQRVHSCRTFLAVRQNNRPIYRRPELSPRLTAVKRRNWVQTASRCPPDKKPLHKRKRTLYRRFLVSLEVRRRTPTSRNRRRRESRHDALWDGGSSSTHPRKPQHSLRRTDYRRHSHFLQLCGAYSVACADVCSVLAWAETAQSGRIGGYSDGPQGISRSRVFL